MAQGWGWSAASSGWSAELGLEVFLCVALEDIAGFELRSGMAHLTFWDEYRGCWADRWGTRMEFKSPLDEVMVAGMRGSL